MGLCTCVISFIRPVKIEIEIILSRLGSLIWFKGLCGFKQEDLFNARGGGFSSHPY